MHARITHAHTLISAALQACDIFGGIRFMSRSPCDSLISNISRGLHIRGGLGSPEIAAGADWHFQGVLKHLSVRRRHRTRVNKLDRKRRQANGLIPMKGNHLLE